MPFDLEEHVSYSISSNPVPVLHCGFLVSIKYGFQACMSWETCHRDNDISLRMTNLRRPHSSKSSQLCANMQQQVLFRFDIFCL
jgi:hypothetical protein